MGLRRTSARFGQLAGTAAMVVALTAGAVAAGDDEAATLFKEALSLSTQAAGATDPAEKVRLLGATDALVERILTEHPDSRLAQLFRAGKPVGRFDRTEIRNQLAAAQAALPAGAAVPAPVAGPAAPVPVVAPQVPARPASPLVGDWIADWNGCKRTMRATMSVPEAENLSFKGYLDLYGRGEGADVARLPLSGFVDPDTYKVTVKYGEWIGRNGYPNLPELDGKIDLKEGVLETSANRLNGCYDSKNRLTLTRASTEPAVGRRIEAMRAVGDDWMKTELATPRPHRVVGKMAEGELKWPDCAGFQAWYASAQPTPRIKVLPDHKPGILPHFADEVSARFFGSPAYYWLPERRDEGYKVFDEVCTPLYEENRDLFHSIKAVFLDSESNTQMWRRLDADRRIVTMIPDYIGKADPAAVQMRTLQTLNSPGEAQQNIRNWYDYPKRYDEGDLKALVEDVRRYQKVVAVELAREVKAELAAVPGDIGGLGQVDALLGEAVKTFGAGFDDQVAEVKAAAEARRAAIVAAVLAARQEQVGQTPPTLEGFRALADIAPQTIREAGESHADAFAPLAEAAEVRRRQIAAVLVAAAVESLAQVPEGAEAFAAIDGVVTQAVADLGDGFEAELAPLRTAAAARKAAIADALVSARVAEIAALPPTTESRDRLTGMVAETLALVRDVDPSAAARLKDAGRALHKAVAQGLVAEGIAALAALPEDMTGFDRVDVTLAGAVASLGTDPDAEANAASLTAAARQRRDAIVQAVVTAAVSDMEKAPRTMEALSSLQARSTALSDRLTAAGYEMQAVTLRNALASYTSQSREAIVEAAAKEVAAMDVTPRNLHDLRSTRERVLAVVGPEPAPKSLPALDAAIAAKMEEMAKVVLEDARKEMEEVPADSDGAAVVREMAAHAAEVFGHTSVAGDFAKLAEARVAAIHAAMADEIIADVNGTKASWKDVHDIDSYVQRATRELRQEQAAAEIARVTKAVDDRIAGLLKTGAEEYRVALANEVPSMDVIGRTARQVARFHKDAERWPGFAGLAEVGTEYVHEQMDTLCAGAADKAGLGGDHDEPVVVGREVVDLGAFACAAAAADVQMTDYDDPGLFGDKVWKLRLFMPNEQWYRIELERREVRPGEFALVGSRVEHDGDIEQLSLKDWRALSGRLVSDTMLAALAPPAEGLCDKDTAAVRALETDERVNFVLKCR